MTDYKLILFAPDGSYVTDGVGLTQEEAIELSGNMGSRWIFYPFHFVIRDKGPVDLNQRVIVPPDMFPHFKNKSLKFVKKVFQDVSEESWEEFFSR